MSQTNVLPLHWQPPHSLSVYVQQSVGSLHATPSATRAGQMFDAVPQRIESASAIVSSAIAVAPVLLMRTGCCESVLLSRTHAPPRE